MNPPLEQPPSLYGKLPNNGDFVSWRLPTTSVGNWDRWLQEFIMNSQDQLGER